MKASFAVAAAAALVGGVSASNVHHRHAHDIFHGLEKKSNGTCVAACTTIYSTYYGEAIVHTHTPTATSASSSAAAATSTKSTAVAVIPTPAAHTCTTTGVYSFPATTLTLTSTVTVVATTSPAVTTTYLPGTYTATEVITTITETSTVVYCPFTSSTVEVVPTTAAPVYTTEVYPTAVYPTTEVYPTSSASATYSATPKPSGGLSGNGNAPWAITYTPYNDAGLCKSASEVSSDIAAIAKTGITAVRVYSTDCSTLTNVGGACAASGMKIILGIFIDAPHCTANNPTVAEQISAIKAWAVWDIVSLISVGNEAIFNGHCTASELAGLINECKSEFSGYTGPYTTADTVSVWQQPEVAAALCDVVDIVGCQAHAFFNTETVASQAGEFVKGQLAIVNAVCPGKVGKVMETGWPSAGKCLGKACPGVTEQSQAIASLLSEVGQDAVFFSHTNDSWKSSDTECACEQYWGCGSLLGA